VLAAVTAELMALVLILVSILFGQRTTIVPYDQPKISIGKLWAGATATLARRLVRRSVTAGGSLPPASAT
jgi:hypothetical protein